MSKLPTIKKELTPVQKAVTTLQVNTPSSLIVATEYLSRVNQFLDTLSAEKHKLTDPLEATLKEIRLRYKPAEQATVALKDILTAKMSQYITNLKEAETKAKEAYFNQPKSSLYDPRKNPKVIFDPPAPKSAVSDAGSVFLIEKEDFEVEDIGLLPKEYIQPVEVAIRRAMLEGIYLPGVRYYKKQIIRNTR